jgi:hypothetical protein
MLVGLGLRGAAGGDALRHHVGDCKWKRTGDCKLRV